eukprot:CAMPEP_0114577932 /NCGR_PEP_ID=MMETSP0125-20121206/2544_1 /TAXON_ID=485358 ORGANISM="Aristerostoma sp., Strain ATCC 50986" /NCGR_SAMPLE_ID=MMETSP0125 /ASSEMBLY_ACC=CAM_ASM_000245 /LENGTH=84 /DNA_ID=CAMNT_0001767641 /DNA_START=1701 /DNA_END=1955 /DNA_ORIENTATION=-
MESSPGVKGILGNKFLKRKSVLRTLKVEKPTKSNGNNLEIDAPINTMNGSNVVKNKRFYFEGNPVSPKSIGKGSVSRSNSSTDS